MSDKPKSKSKPKASKASSKKLETKSSIKSKKKDGHDKGDKSPKSTIKSKKSKKSVVTKTNNDNKTENDLDETKSNLTTNMLNNEPTIPIGGPSPDLGGVSHPEKCEGCFQGDGYIYCTNCGKVYCKICDDQLHIVPAYRSHERTPLASLSSMNTNCYHHNLPLRLYCESCDEPVCQNCQVMGPHNTQLHRVSSLFDVYRRRLNDVKDKIERFLNIKQAKIESIMANIDDVIKTTKMTASDILKGVNNEYEISIENLNKCEGKKLAMLNFNSANIQKDIVAIESLLNDLNIDYNDYSSSSSLANNLSKMNINEENDQLTFLLKYKGMSEKIDSLITKPASSYSLSKVEADSLLKWPEELNDAKKRLEEYDKIKILLKIKNDIIWNFLTIPYETRTSELDEIKLKTEKEISEWSKLSDKYANELKKYNLVCAYCGCYLDNIKINENCPCNNTKNFTNKQYTKEIPPEEIHGTGRHWFKEPTEAYEAKIKITKEEQAGLGNTNPFERNMLNEINKNNDNDISKQFLSQSFSNDWVIALAAFVEKEKINLFQVLTEFDLDADGLITLDELLAAFDKVGIRLKVADKDSMIKYLLTGNTNNRIDIKSFARNFVRKKSKNELDNIEKVIKINDSVDQMKRINLHFVKPQ